MRFSIRSLGILVLFAALGVSAYAKFRSAAVKQAQADVLRTTLQKHRFAVSEEREFAWQHSRQRLNDSIQQHRALTEHLAPVFRREVAKMWVSRVANHVGVREIPMLKQPGILRHMWAVYMPERRMVSVQVNFADDSPLVEDFVDQKRTTVALDSGEHFIVATFTYQWDSDVSNAAEPRKPLFTVSLDGEIIVRHESIHDEVKGRSSTSFDFKQQKNYAPNRLKVAPLLDVKPRPGDCSIRIRLVEVAE